ncbi:hypothetical protein K1719_046167 [Acacia pycnantha]|nr:hypothetical protein K1719_046167 [Acacia pycnantha]
MSIQLSSHIIVPASFLIAVAVAADEEAFIGINIGTAITDMPSPTQIVALLKAQNIQHVRLYDADQAMLLALARTRIRVTISVPNEQILAIGQSNATAANWVSRNVVAHVPATDITSIAVGSEVLTTLPNAGPVLVSALTFIHSALVASNLDQQIKVSTPHSSSIILDSFPPSQAFFNRTWDPVMVPLLKFLQSTGSFLMLNVYPYYDYILANGAIPLDYALFRPLPPNKEAVDGNTLLHYTNVFDAVVDAAYFAMSYLNFTNIPILVTESGWPSKGGSSESDATLDNANTYNSNLVKHVLNNTGTPKHPGVANNVDIKMLQAALDWACGPGKVDCSVLLQGQPCYEPNNVVSHATYAFDAYYQKMDKSSGTCDFKGVAIITTTDPSHGSCVFPGSGGKNRTSTNGTSLAPSSNSTSSGYFSKYFHNGEFFTSSFVIGMLVWSAIVM